MSNFLIPFSVKVTEKQEKEIVLELIKLGYIEANMSRNFPDCNILASKWGGENNHLGIGYECIKYDNDRIYFTEYNKDLILAVAAMRDDDVFHVGEWIFANGERHTRNNECFPMNKMWRIRRIHKDKDEYNGGNSIYVDSSSTTITGTCTGSACIRKATLEEICNHYGYELKGNNVVRKDDFVLPEKWCVEHSKEALAWIRENAEKNGEYIATCSWYMYPCDECGHYGQSNTYCMLTLNCNDMDKYKKITEQKAIKQFYLDHAKELGSQARKRSFEAGWNACVEFYKLK